jgi:signal transduction histidine kinase/CheY-like chemotaxis protein
MLREDSGVAESHELGEKYRALLEEHERLLRRCEEDAVERSNATHLALATMRSVETALATVREGALVVRNDRWLKLAQEPGPPWVPVSEFERTSGPEYSSLDALALEESAAVLRGRERVRVARFRRGAGEAFIEVRLEHIAAREGRPLVLVMVSDVTAEVRRRRDLARLREAMFEQERLRTVGQIASGVAHDLNNTLHALSLRIARLRVSPRVMDEQADNVEVMRRITTDAAARVRRLQDLAQRRGDRPRGVADLGRVVSGAVEVATSEVGKRRHAVSGISIEARVPPATLVPGDASELQHVFVSLLLNARDAMARGGRIVVEAEREGEWVLVTVADEGMGIAAEHLSRIFDPFFTTKGRRRTGLGLAVANGVMRRLGGAIEAANQPGGGAVFTLRFPVVAAEPPPRRDAEPADSEPGGSRQPLERLPMRRVLVVDDDEDNLEAAKWVLEELGQHVEVTASGSDAVARVEAGDRYDLVLCDLGMADLSGWDVAGRIRAVAPATTVYIVTGWAQEVSLDDPRRALVAGVLPKPLEVGELERLVRSIAPEDVERLPS